MKIILVLLTIIAFTACDKKPKLEEVSKVETVIHTPDTIKKEKPIKDFSEEYARFIHTENTYEKEKGSIIIQNSYPKGGIPINGENGYTDPIMNRYSYGQFWTRIINKTDKALDLTVRFPSDSLHIDTNSDNYFKLSVPQKLLEPYMLSHLNYGYEVSEAATFLDSTYGKPTELKKSIKPNEAYMFYVTQLIHLDTNGAIRTGFVLEEENLMYKIDINPYGKTALSAGKLVFK